MLSAKQSSIKYHFWDFCMTRRSDLLFKEIMWLKKIPNKWEEMLST